MMRGGGFRIVVDARAMGGSGIGRYLEDVLDVLLRDPRFGHVQLLGDTAKLRNLRIEGGPRVAVAEFPTRFYRAGFQARWGRARLSGDLGADVYFFPHYDAPLLLPERSVVVVHDLIHFKVPQAFGRPARAAAAVLLRQVVGRAAHVLVPSPSTRRDLLERFPTAAEKVSIAPLGMNPAFTSREATSPDAEAAALSLRPYLLCVGNRKPHKNFLAVVEALPRLHRLQPSLRMVVAGASFPGWERVLARAAELGVGSSVTALDDVDDDRLRALYRHAEALIFPSLYEGLGLPLLEAMALEAPVIASDRSSVPEVVGDAGLLFDPDDPEALAECVERLWREPGLRSALVGRGLRRFEEFRWRDTARGVVDVLAACAAGPLPGRVPDFWPAKGDVSGPARVVAGGTGQL